MNQSRKSLIMQAFRKLDKTADGCVTIEDLKGVYNVSKHPKFLSGEWNEDKCLEEFLSSFEVRGNKDGKVSRTTEKRSKASSKSCSFTASHRHYRMRFTSVAPNNARS